MKRKSPNPIKAARERFGWTQDQMAGEMGVNVRTLARYEAGSVTPMARKLVDLLIKVEDLALQKLASTPEHATEDGDVLCVSG